MQLLQIHFGVAIRPVVHVTKIELKQEVTKVYKKKKKLAWVGGSNLGLQHLISSALTTTQSPGLPAT